MDIDFSDFEESPAAAYLYRKIVLDNLNSLRFGYVEGGIGISTVIDQYGSYRVLGNAQQISIIQSDSSRYLFFPQLRDTFDVHFDTPTQAMFAVMKASALYIGKTLTPEMPRGGIVWMKVGAIEDLPPPQFKVKLGQTDKAVANHWKEGSRRMKSEIREGGGRRRDVHQSAVPSPTSTSSWANRRTSCRASKPRAGVAADGGWERNKRTSLPLRFEFRSSVDEATAQRRVRLRAQFEDRERQLKEAREAKLAAAAEARAIAREESRKARDEVVGAELEKAKSAFRKDLGNPSPAIQESVANKQRALRADDEEQDQQVEETRDAKGDINSDVVSAGGDARKGGDPKMQEAETTKREVSKTHRLEEAAPSQEGMAVGRQGSVSAEMDGGEQHAEETNEVAAAEEEKLVRRASSRMSFRRLAELAERLDKRRSAEWGEAEAETAEAKAAEPMEPKVDGRVGVGTTTTEEGSTDAPEKSAPQTSRPQDEIISEVFASQLTKAPRGRLKSRRIPDEKKPATDKRREREMAAVEARVVELKQYNNTTASAEDTTGAGDSTSPPGKTTPQTSIPESEVLAAFSACLSKRPRRRKAVRKADEKEPKAEVVPPSESREKAEDGAGEANMSVYGKSEHDSSPLQNRLSVHDTILACSLNPGASDPPNPVSWYLTEWSASQRSQQHEGRSTHDISDKVPKEPQPRGGKANDDAKPSISVLTDLRSPIIETPPSSPSEFSSVGGLLTPQGSETSFGIPEKGRDAISGGVDKEELRDAIRGELKGVFGGIMKAFNTAL